MVPPHKCAMAKQACFPILLKNNNAATETLTAPSPIKPMLDTTTITVTTTVDDGDSRGGGDDDNSGGDRDRDDDDHDEDKASGIPQQLGTQRMAAVEQLAIRRLDAEIDEKRLKSMLKV